MKKAYKPPVVEMLEFDYTNVVATSVGKTDTVDDVANTCGGSDPVPNQNLFGTSDEQWCH